MILVWISAAFLAGVLGGTVLPLPPLLIALLSVVLVASAGVRPKMMPGCMVALALLLGFLRAPHPPGTPGPHDIGHYLGHRVQVTGVVAAEPDVHETFVNYTVAVENVTSGTVTSATQGRLEVHVPRSISINDGDRVSVTGYIRAPRVRPGLLGGPATGIASAEMSFPQVSDLGGAGGGWLSWIQSFRQYLTAAIDGWLPEPEAALLVAITLGAHSASLGDLTQILIATGLIHVIAISGIKVALVAGSLYEIAMLSRRRGFALLLSLAGLAFYVLLTGATVSGLRSALMWAMVFLAAYLGRRTVTVVSLSFVAALLVALDPRLVWDISFLLSAVGTFAIVSLTPPLLRAARYLPSPLREAFCVTVAAQIGTLPIVAVGFGVVSASGPLANALVLPLLPVLIAVGLILGLVGGLPLLAAPVAALAYALLHLIVLTATTLATLPFAFPAPLVSPLTATVYYGVLGALAFWILRRVHGVPEHGVTVRSRETIASIALAGTLVTFSLVRAPVGPPQLVWLGSGQAWLVSTGHSHILIDGSSHPFNLLEQLGKVMSWRDRSIDTVIVTDPHSSNVIGLEGVLDRFHVGTVLDLGAEYPSQSYAAWRQLLRDRHIPVYALVTGAMVTVPGIRVVAVAPSGPCPQPANCAAILRVIGPHRTILLAGMADQEEQLETEVMGAPLRSEIVVTEAPLGLSPSFRRITGAQTVLRADLSGLSPVPLQLYAGTVTRLGL